MTPNSVDFSFLFFFLIGHAHMFIAVHHSALQHPHLTQRTDSAGSCMIHHQVAQQKL